MNLDIAIPDSAIPFFARHRNCFKKGGTAQESIVADFRNIEPHLPPRESVRRILDIGCGMAGIDVLLRRRYPEAQLWLLDGDGADPRDGWQVSRPEAFSSRHEADKLLSLNGVHADRWIDVNTPEHLQADLIISLASWGYHYPLSTYNVSGFCIADLRRSEEKPRGSIIMQGKKFDRCAWSQGVQS